MILNKITGNLTTLFHALQEKAEPVLEHEEFR